MVIAPDFGGPHGIVAVTVTTASTGGYGSNTIDGGGNWTFALDDGNAAVNALNEGEVLTDSFDVVADDGTTQTDAVNITGANDAATFGGDLSGNVTEDADVHAGGTATVADVDAGQGGIVAASGATAYGSYAIDQTGCGHLQP